jgi:hypothetical protein
MVAACKRALTEVGASIALYSQVCRGSCADLAMAPPNVRKATAVTVGKGNVPILAMVSVKEKVPKLAYRIPIAPSRQMSPIRVIKKTLAPARTDSGRLYQKEISE